jgi:HAE1 family hydrophobic/amphiphilic exporter-1
MNLPRLAIRRPTFITSLLAALLIIGVISLFNMSVRMFPDVEFPYVLVQTQYTGAGPEEIEQLVSKPMEDAISAVSGIKHINSISQDSYSIVYAEFNLEKNPDIALQEVKDKVAAIRNDLPDEIEEPVIQKLDPDSLPIMVLSLKADMSPKELYDFADDKITKDLARVDGTSQIEIIGGAKREIHVNVDRKKLHDFETTLTAVSNAINASSLNVPIGKINRGATELSFRTIGEFRTIKQIGDVVISFVGNDVPVKVADIAELDDSTEDEYSRGRITVNENGTVTAERAMLVNVYKQSKSNDVKISDGLWKEVAKINKKYADMPSRPELTVVSDNARGVRMNIEDVRRTILEGVFLAIIVVYFFLGSWRSTFITALALPNSLIGAFVFMNIAGFSINVLTLMSLSLAVGLLIDDAIVVRENIFRHYEEGADPVTAAENGTNEVLLAVIATTSTVIAVFLPLGFLTGIMGRFFKEFGFTVVFAMMISVVDALTIAPMLSAYIIPSHESVKNKKTNKFVAAFSYIVRLLTVNWFEKLYSVVVACYEWAITIVLKYKKTTLALSLAVFVFSLGLAKQLQVSFMPSSEFGEFSISLEAEPGTSLDQMDKIAKSIEALVSSEPDVEMVVTSVGNVRKESNIASIFIKMVPYEQRRRTTGEMKDYVRKKVAENIHIKGLAFSVVDAGGLGGGRSDFIMQFMGADTATLDKAAAVIRGEFAKIPHLVDIKSNYRAGKPELQIHMDAKRMELLGVNSVTAGMELRAMVDGNLAAKYRQMGREYDIRVQLKEAQKNLLEAFNDTYIFNVNQRLIKLKNVAFPIEAEGPTKIYKVDRGQFITVEGNLNVGGATGNIQKEAVRIFNELKNSPEYKEDWKHIEYSFSGDAEEMGTMFFNMMFAALMGMIFIYMVLASLYESLITPFTIMSALPLAIVGGLAALYVTGQYIDMFTMIGFIMLLGIVAKNSILLVDYIQQLMRAGYAIHDAIIKAGKVRLRPILMTSFAIIAGMLPMALGLTEVGKFRRGMGIVIVGGIISSTILTLLVVPAIFEYLDRFRRFTRKLFGRPEKRFVDYDEVTTMEKPQQ